MLSKKEIINALEENKETYFDTDKNTVYIYETTSGYDYYIFRLGEKPNEDSSFNLYNSLDGGVIEEVDIYKAVTYLFDILKLELYHIIKDGKIFKTLTFQQVLNYVIEHAETYNGCFCNIDVKDLRDDEKARIFLFAADLIKTESNGENILRIYVNNLDLEISADFEYDACNELKLSDGYLRQLGFVDGTIVSTFNIFKDNVNIAQYGSISAGEQRIFVNYNNEDGTLVPLNEGEVELLKCQPKKYLRALTLQNVLGKDYIFEDLSCWFEMYFMAQNGKDLTLNNEQTQADSEYVHGYITEAVFLHEDTLKEILNESELIN